MHIISFWGVKNIKWKAMRKGFLKNQQLAWRIINDDIVFAYAKWDCLKQNNGKNHM